MIRARVLIGTLILFTALAATAATRDSERFATLLDDQWRNATAEQIFFRSDPDGWRPNGKLSEHTPQAFERRRKFNESILKRLSGIRPERLTDSERVSYELFRYEREAERASYDSMDRYFPITKLFGYHTYFAEAPAAMAFLDTAAYETYLVSLEDFARYNAEHIELLREAVKRGYVHYCESMRGYEDTISTHIVDDPRDSALYLPFTRFPAQIRGDARETLTERGTTLIRESVVPAYRELLAFFTGEYMPACRNSPGIGSVDGGDAYYQYLVTYFTTTDLTPRNIHALGIAEVERIRAEMNAIIGQVGFDGSFREFLDHLRSEPRFYAESVEELLQHAALISKRMEAELPRYFGLLPRNTYGIKANMSRGSFYMPSSGDGKTSGTYFVGAGQLDAQPLYALEALSFHEGVPGHHLQTALALELDLPEFRRTLYHSAYGEGWGLYSEKLGKEVGFYKDPYSDFGRLTYEAWRACRLVVDTGMHAFGWSRQQAIDYMLANTALSEHEVAAEIDRYITWPAQALAYKIGELRILALRRHAEAELGERFDIRAFHDTVIGNGSLPIAVLERIVNEWVQARASE